jgi:hypothetical protein
MIYITLLLGSDGVWSLFILLTASAANGHLEHYALLLVCLLFSLLAEPETSLGGPVPAPHRTPTKKLQVYSPRSWTALQFRRTVIITRLHGVTAHNTVMLQHHDCASPTINLAGLHEVIWNVYEVHTVPTYSVYR